MNKTITLRNMSRTGFLFIGIMAALLITSFVGIQTAIASITASLDVGSTGSQVTELQTYLATNASIYPEGLVTGYFGPLTQAAVQRFQTAQGIVSSGTAASTGYGRVGPMTRARINSLMGGNPGSNVSWDTVPAMSPISVQKTNTTATFSWATNELTLGEVYWSIAPIQANEATGPRQKPYVSGALAVDAGGQHTNHSVTVSNLQPNTPYNYLVRSIDNGGNLTTTWPYSFRTNQ